MSYKHTVVNLRKSYFDDRYDEIIGKLKELKPDGGFEKSKWYN